jgi:hypothetical protein
MTMHNALTSKDIEVLFTAAEADGRARVVERALGVEVEAGETSFDGVGREGLQRLVACGYLEGGPDVFEITRAGREYAESMR